MLRNSIRAGGGVGKGGLRVREGRDWIDRLRYPMDSEKGK